MNYVDWERVKGVYGDALELPPEQRAGFVESATGEHSEVRLEVLRLLREEDELGDFMSPLTIIDKLAGIPAPERTTAFGNGQLVANRYRIVRRIQSGGMGEVYEAYDSKLGQRIALKTILPEIARLPRVMARFRREIAIARTVTHPNVCRIFDLGEHTPDGGSEPITFLSMEYLDGQTVAERLRRDGPMTTAQALPYVLQILDALDAAHRAGVIHRDLKPSNIMLVPDGGKTDRAVVTDFGIARSVQDDSAETRLTGSRGVVGTPDYMAPEQWTGGDVDATTDLYALAVVVHEMVSGEKPKWPRSPGVVPDERWAAVIDTCLERNPRARPQTAQAVIAALRDASAPKSHVWTRRAAAASLLIASVVALSWGFSRLSIWKQLTESKAAPKHVVVLPFRVGEQELQVFADGLMETITQRLSQYEGVNQELVVASARENHQGLGSVREAKLKFGADYAVEGTLHAQQNRMRLVLTVVDTATLHQMESTTIDGTRDKVFALQDDAVSKLANALNMKVQPKYAAELNRVSPMHPGAYDFYLQAKGYLQRNDRLADINSAIALLNRAREIAPDNAGVHSALAEAYWFKHERTADPQWVSKAAEECRRALALDNSLAETHVIWGRVLAGTGKQAEAGVEFRKALDIDPRLPEAYQGLGRAYLESKDYAQAEAAYRKAIELRSRDWRGYKELGSFFYKRSEYRKAIEQFEKVVALSPDNASAYNNLGGFYGLLGEKTKAREMLEKAIEIEPDRVSTLTNLTKLLFDEGRHEEAFQRWNRAVERNPTSFRLWGNLGAAYIKASRQADAQRAFTEAVRLTGEAIRVNPKNGELYSYRAHFLSPLGRKSDALADIERAASLTGTDVEMLVRDAVTLAQLGQNEKAMQYVAAAIKRGYQADQVQKNEDLRKALEQKEKGEATR
ncbi:MAG: tetratricopeptide repeat protein [Acidobacteria bacterium]|nr:tetratricopeptide repeat protein [Acidobacteriota bacterium]